jgi:hypothetical protein
LHGATRRSAAPKLRAATETSTSAKDPHAATDPTLQLETWVRASNRQRRRKQLNCVSKVTEAVSEVFDVEEGYAHNKKVLGNEKIVNDLIPTW